MSDTPDRPPLLPPTPRPAALGERTRPAPASESTTPARARRLTPRMWAFVAVGTAFALLVVALGVQTWRLNQRPTAATAPSTTGPRPTASSRPGPSTTPSTTPPTTASPTPGGAGDAAGLRCLSDLIGQPPNSRIARGSLGVQVDSIAVWDERERELDFTQLPEPALLTPDELSSRVERDVDQAYSPAEADLDSRLLSSLGAVPPGTDMRSLVSGFLGAEVAGFYDPTTKQLVIGTYDGRRPLNTSGEVTMAHELTHALTDQALGLPSLEPQPLPTGVLDTDRTTARRSLVEGDATLVMLRYILSALSPQQQQQFLSDPSQRGASTANVPNYLRSELTFPYEAGLEFTCAIKQSGSWANVNAAYSQPPTTSAQILLPERFVAREAAADAPDPGALSGPWIKDRAQTMGAAELLWLFKAPGDNPAAALKDPKAATAGWGGGETVQWSNGKQTAVGISLAERSGGGGGLASQLSFRPSAFGAQTTPAGAPKLCDSVRDWYTAAFPGSQVGAPNGDEVKSWTEPRQSAVLRCTKGNVRLGIGPDLATARALVA